MDGQGGAGGLGEQFGFGLEVHFKIQRSNTQHIYIYTYNKHSLTFCKSLTVSLAFSSSFSLSLFCHHFAPPQFLSYLSFFTFFKLNVCFLMKCFSPFSCILGLTCRLLTEVCLSLCVCVSSGNTMMKLSVVAIMMQLFWRKLCNDSITFSMLKWGCCAFAH